MDALSGLYNTSPKNKQTARRRTQKQKPKAARKTAKKTNKHTVKPTGRPTVKPTGRPTVKPTGRPTGRPTRRHATRLDNRQLAELYLEGKEKIMREYYNERNKNLLHGERLAQYQNKRYSRNQLLQKIQKDLDIRDKERKAITANLIHYFDNIAHFKLIQHYEQNLELERDNQLLNYRMFNWFKARPGKRFFKSDIESVFPEPEYYKLRVLLNETVADEGVLGWSIEQIQRTKDIEAGFDPKDSGSKEIYYYAPLFPGLKHPGKGPQYKLSPLFEIPSHSIKGIKTPEPVLPEQAGMTPTYGDFDWEGGVQNPPGGGTPDGSPAAGAGGTPDYGNGGQTPQYGNTPPGGTPDYANGGQTPMYVPPPGGTPEYGNTPPGGTPDYANGGQTPMYVPPPGGATPDGSPAAGAGGTPDYGNGGQTPMYVPPPGGATPDGAQTPMYVPPGTPSPKSVIQAGNVVLKVDTRPQEEQLVEKMGKLSISARKPKPAKKKLPCKNGKIRHPETGRCVKPDGPSMRAYLKKQER